MLNWLLRFSRAESTGAWIKLFLLIALGVREVDFNAVILLFCYFPFGCPCVILCCLKIH